MKLQRVEENDFSGLLAAIERDEAALVCLSEPLVEAKAFLKDVDRPLRKLIRPEADPPGTMFPSRLAIAPHLTRRVFQWSADGARVPQSVLDEALNARGKALSALMTAWTSRLMLEFGRRYSCSLPMMSGLGRRDHWVLNAIHYPALPDHQDEVRFPVHRDWGLFACYPAMQGEGLELFLEGNWVPVELKAREMLVYAGMGATLFANRLLGKPRLRAVSHRVMQRSSIGRSVLIYYVDPPRDLELPDGRPFGQFIFEQRSKIHQF